MFTRRDWPIASHTSFGCRSIDLLGIDPGTSFQGYKHRISSQQDRATWRKALVNGMTRRHRWSRICFKIIRYKLVQREKSLWVMLFVGFWRVLEDLTDPDNKCLHIRGSFVMASLRNRRVQFGPEDLEKKMTGTNHEAVDVWDTQYTCFIWSEKVRTDPCFDVLSWYQAPPGGYAVGEGCLNYFGLLQGSFVTWPSL